jgi:hypothetical protein
MAVVIHDFEVEVKSEPQSDESNGQQEPGAPEPPSAQEIERLLIREQERQARVFAH